MPCHLIRSPGCGSVWHRVCVQAKPAGVFCSRSPGRGPRANTLLHRRRGKKIEPAVQLLLLGWSVLHDSDRRQSKRCSRRQAEVNHFGISCFFQADLWSCQCHSRRQVHRCKYEMVTAMSSDWWLINIIDCNFCNNLLFVTYLSVNKRILRKDCTYWWYHWGLRW